MMYARSSGPGTYKSHRTSAASLREREQPGGSGRARAQRRARSGRGVAAGAGAARLPDTVVELGEHLHVTGCPSIQLNRTNSLPPFEPLGPFAMAKRSSAAVAAEAAAPARKRGRRSAPQSSADPAGAGAQCDAEPGESEYERQRRLNIKRNQELLDTLGISSALQEVTVVQVGACSTLQSRAVCCSPCARISDPHTHGVSSAARPREGHHCQSRAEKKEQRTRA